MDPELRDLRRGARREQRRLVPDPDPVEPERDPVQVDLAGEIRPTVVPRLSCAGTAESRHEPIMMSIGTAGPPLELECPRCARRYVIKEMGE